MAIQMMGQKALYLLEKKLDEIKERVENNIGVIDNEQIRLLWFLSPPIYNFELLHYAEKYGAVVVQSWIELVFSGYDQTLLDPANPLESIARKLMCRPDSPNFQFFPEAMIKVVKQLKVDGVIDAVMRSCGVVPGLLRTLKDGVFKATGVPSLLVDADYSDDRECDETAVKASLDTFIATLLRKKGV
jgi:benzoyl-CoA reductase/2-hydroxyglutaryl-CoA dehydratase subunit BcrC/BadD/HgdB